MGDLTDFLLARIADDEAVAANLIAEGPWSDFHCRDMSGPVRDDELSTLHIGAARVLVECEAKRLAVEWASMEPSDDQVMCFLALPYADHPDYRDEWRS